MRWILSLTAALPLLATAARAQVEASAPVNESAASASAQEATIDTVEVRARREALRHAIHAFVSTVTRSDGEVPARWRYPICPSVSGVSRGQGEFIRSRILEIAASAGAALDDDRNCRANLFVVLTPEADHTLAGWQARNPRMRPRESTETTGGPHVARPVRIWHNVVLNNVRHPL